MNEFTTFLISTAAISLISLITWRYNTKKKERRTWETISSSPDTSWKKVGKVKEIFYYPLKSGKGISIDECSFEKFGIAVHKATTLSLKDRMFLVYNEKTRKFQTGRQYSKLLLVNVSAVDGNKVKLEVADMPALTIDLPKDTDQNAKIVSMWYDESVKCLDCGDAAAAWFSKFLHGSDSNLRLGLYVPDYNRDVVAGAFKDHAKVYSSMRNEDIGLFSDLSSYMLMSESSVADLNSRLSKPISPLQLRPNIVVEGCRPYAEDGWEWIKIGAQAVIRNFKLCTRCTMVRIDPDTGIPNPQYEPLKTLRSYRKLTDPEKIKVEDDAPAMGIYCGLYRSGIVKVGDEVCVYQTN